MTDAGAFEVVLEWLKFKSLTGAPNLGPAIDTLEQELDRRQRPIPPCKDCGAPGMGDAYYDNYPGEDPRRCTTCGML